jgi:hypothetical protein
MADLGVHAGSLSPALHTAHRSKRSCWLLKTSIQLSVFSESQIQDQKLKQAAGKRRRLAVGDWLKAMAESGNWQLAKATARKKLLSF